MHFISELPNRKYYELVDSNRDDQFWFLDKASPSLRIRSPIINPFGEQWCILPSYVYINDIEHNQKVNYKIDLKLFRISEINEHHPRGTLIREMIKGNGFSLCAPICFVFPRKHPKDRDNRLIPITLTYRFVPD